jgi:sporulation protein YlmC with PRC-barrel domain
MADLETRETSDLISSEKVEGTAVMNRQGEKLGSIESVMIEKRSGRVAYAVMSFGGFLGIGDQHHPVPWSSLTYDTNAGGYVIDADRARLQGAPVYKSSETPNWSDRQWGQRVHQYYGVRPYWE